MKFIVTFLFALGMSILMGYAVVFAMIFFLKIFAKDKKNNYQSKARLRSDELRRGKRANSTKGGTPKEGVMGVRIRKVSGPADPTMPNILGVVLQTVGAFFSALAVFLFLNFLG